MLHWSNTAHQTILSCEEKYYLRNVRRLRPFVGDFAPELGKLLHSYLAGYYAGLKIGMNSEDAHAAGHLMLNADAVKVQSAVEVSFFAGDEVAAARYDRMIPDARAICEGYYLYRGQYDGDMYEVLFVEETIDAQIPPNIRSRSIIDMLARERESGRVCLWEHKSTTSVPDADVRMRDLQTLLYARVIEKRYKVPVDKVVWNYLRTKLPAIPHQNKPDKFGRAKFSKAVGIDTTWEIYETSLIEANEPLEEYADVRARLYNAGLERFYPRFEHVIIASGDVLLRDYISQARRTAKLEQLWATGKVKPIRRFSRDCNYCSFKPVCEAAVLGGDPEDVIAMRFSTPEQRKAVPETIAIIDELMED